MCCCGSDDLMMMSFNFSRYHDQIAILEAKFPSETALPFTWEDAFSKASVFSGKPSLGE